jgi:ATP-dependent protease ClpP protease subunit
MALQKINITGPLFQYTMNDARIIQEQFNSFEANDEVEITWHCPGGDIREGNKIFDIIMQHKGPTTSRILLAASAGSYAATAANRMVVYDFSEFMIHQAHIYGGFNCHRGNIDDFIKALDEQKPTLEKLDNSIANVYAKRCNMDHGKVMEYMTQETTWRGEEIKKIGFATDFLDTPARDTDKEFTNLADAKFDLSCYANHEKSRFHKRFGEGIDAREAWFAQTATLANLGNTAPAKPTAPSDEHVKLAQIAMAKRRMEQMALDRMKLGIK